MVQQNAVFSLKVKLEFPAEPADKIYQKNSGEIIIGPGHWFVQTLFLSKFLKISKLIVSAHHFPNIPYMQAKQGITYWITLR